MNVAYVIPWLGWFEHQCQVTGTCQCCHQLMLVAQTVGKLADDNHGGYQNLLWPFLRHSCHLQLLRWRWQATHQCFAATDLCTQQLDGCHQYVFHASESQLELLIDCLYLVTELVCACMDLHRSLITPASCAIRCWLGVPGESTRYLKFHCDWLQDNFVISHSRDTSWWIRTITICIHEAWVLHWVWRPVFDSFWLAYSVQIHTLWLLTDWRHQSHGSPGRPVSYWEPLIMCMSSGIVDK